MAGGAKSAALRIGVPVEIYIAEREAGNLWCSWKRHWVPEDGFTIARDRPTGRHTYCKQCRSEKRE